MRWIVLDDIDLLLGCPWFVVCRQRIEIEAEHRSLSGHPTHGFHGHETRYPEASELADSLSSEDGPVGGGPLLFCVSPPVTAHR